MGNGALPHGPSYRAHPRLYLSGGSQGGEFTSAFGGVAEVHGRTASAAFDAFDPNRSLGGSKSRTAVVSCCAGDVLSLFGQTDRFERLAAVIVIGGDWH
jgi:hypothetical protein